MGKLVGPVAYVLGVLMIVGGIVTWWQVSDQLSAEAITVPDDANCQAGADVSGPYSAYCMADIINHHALNATEGKTYAQLDRDDPLRATAMNASFLRSSLFTSVVAFGLAGMAIAVGVLFVLLGGAVASYEKRFTELGAGASTG
jgi:hypothetical protein